MLTQPTVPIRWCGAREPGQRQQQEPSQRHVVSVRGALRGQGWETPTAAGCLPHQPVSVKTEGYGTDFCLKSQEKEKQTAHPHGPEASSGHCTRWGPVPDSLATAGCWPRSVSGFLGFQQPLCCPLPTAPSA